ncbi:hypothetical protein RF11_09395 [Thelohanellus kitauei]|uniref:Uncharacterized protein n=1 Tax=Thelohanellus kitauei TaxID=669202 RepID=A0A0C2I9W6_THEKT|nr:hypothetical protein RF11_09395 [Thelohanellus kitauei]
MDIEELIKDPENANVYYCPHRSTKNCRCLEEFVTKHFWMNQNLGSPEKALKLLKDLRREALELSKERCTTNDIKSMNDDGRTLKCRGFERSKSKNYDQYIINTSSELQSHGICEVAAQKILKCSHSIIHNNLKHDNEGRTDLIADKKFKVKPN